MSNKTFVYASVQKEGYHNFPESATLPQFATGDEYDVSHLAHRHFHYFYIKVWVQVTHHNRNIEFIQLRRWLDRFYGNETLEFGAKSCEMIADELTQTLSSMYPKSEIRVDVSEDNINGAYSEYVPITA